MAKEEPKAEAAAGGAKAPLFSGTGLVILVGAVAVAGGIPTFLLMGKGKDGAPHAAPGKTDEGHGDAESASGEAHPWPNNKVVLDSIQGKYRDTGQGSGRRNFSVSVVLEIRTDTYPEEAGGGGGHGGGGSEPKGDKEIQKKDTERKKMVEAQSDWIKDKIHDILRGKGPEDFATNEMVEQVKQQIKRVINEEKFGSKGVIVGVLFPVQNF